MHPTPKLRILLLVHSFNSLAQRFFVELNQWGHEVSVEYDIHESVTLEAIALFRPDLIVAPFLKRILSPAIHERYPCLIVHPGIVGDRGPSALDWAILDGESQWGVTILKAASEVDAGPVLGSRSFVMRGAPKSAIYRDELTEAAVLALGDVLAGWGLPAPLQRLAATLSPAASPWRPLMRQKDRGIDWSQDDSATILRKIRSADAHPGVDGEIKGQKVKIYGGHVEERLRGASGALLAQRHGALCIGTVDGAVWITHLKRQPQNGDERTIKLPAATVLGRGLLADTPHDIVPFAKITTHASYQDIYYEVKGGVGYLHFAVHGGALSSELCARLSEAYRALAAMDGVRVLVLCGGDDFWMNGIDLNAIESAPSPADASWTNINALNDFVRQVIDSTSIYTIAAMAGGAAAGGAFVALACDERWARQGIVLSPHYKNMGNLYGSEYWTYLLAKRVAAAGQRDEVLALRVPIGVQKALSLGLIDCVGAGEKELFWSWVRAKASRLANDESLAAMLGAKGERRDGDEKQKPLELYRQEELAHMKMNFYGWDPSYHKARYNFVHRIALSRTPRYLARHRDPNFSKLS